MNDEIFDIATESVEETTTIHLKNAAGDLMFADTDRTKPVQIVLYGPGSTQFGVVEAAQNARQTKRFNDNDMKLSSQAREEALRETAEDLAAVTKQFVNFRYSGAPDAHGTDLYVAVYSNPKLGFVVKQVQKTLKDWAAFKKGSGVS